MDQGEGFVLRIRGLPWQATREEIENFFSGCKIRNGINGIFMTLSREGRPSGEAYIDMETEDDYKRGLDMNKKYLGSRYIEVFPSKISEMEFACRKQGNVNDGQTFNEDSFLRLRGLPFTSNEDDLMKFFAGLDIVMDGIVMPKDQTGRSTGEAYIQFTTREIAEKAMGKHKDKIGHRYIEIFKSSYQEFRAMKNYVESRRSHHPHRTEYNHGSYGSQSIVNHHQSNSYPYHKMRLSHPTHRPAPYPPDRFARGPSGPYGPITGASRGPPPGTSRRMYDYDDYRARPPYGSRQPYHYPMNNHGEPPFISGRHTVHMRGLPYKTDEREIFEFFLPLHPVSVNIIYDDLGRASGEADVEFATHEDAVKAMNKDKAFIQKRYIELFLSSSPSAPRSLSPPYNDVHLPPHHRYGNPPSNGANIPMGPMGNWESSIVPDDFRSRE